MKPLTIVAATTIHHHLTKKAIERTIECLPMPVKVLTLGDRSIIEGETFIKKKIDNIVDYNQLMLKEVGEYIDTDHFLIVQYDGFAVDKKLWDPDFLSYDYIGAPWIHTTPGGITCGNGGFSLRSKRLMDAIQDPVVSLDLTTKDGFNEDLIICNKFGDYLTTRYGLKFAPQQVAERFSFEKATKHMAGRTFGMHAVWNVPIYLNEQETNEFFQNIPYIRPKEKTRAIKNCLLRGYKDAVSYIDKIPEKAKVRA